MELLLIMCVLTIAILITVTTLVNKSDKRRAQEETEVFNNIISTLDCTFMRFYTFADKYKHLICLRKDTNWIWNNGRVNLLSKECLSLDDANKAVNAFKNKFQISCVLTSGCKIIGLELLKLEGDPVDYEDMVQYLKDLGLNMDVYYTISRVEDKEVKQVFVLTGKKDKRV